jgi:hypothetical protein
VTGPIPDAFLPPPGSPKFHMLLVYGLLAGVAAVFVILWADGAWKSAAVLPAVAAVSLVAAAVRAGASTDD